MPAAEVVRAVAGVEQPLEVNAGDLADDTGLQHLLDLAVARRVTVVEGDGLLYVGCGFLITVIPLLIIGAIARLYYKVNYFTLMGLIAGSNTDPPALAYANQTTSGDAPAVG